LHDKRYVVGRVLGQGGFGVTYLGYDSVFQRMVAIKEYMPTHLASRHRDSVTIISGHGENGENFISGLKLFIEEARNVAKLNRHANVVRVENYFEENNTAYMVMQYVKGPSLSTLMKERGGHMEWKEVCSFMLPILDALEMIHKKNIFHRDISLQNILLLDGKVPVLIDFGASRVVAGEQSRSIDIVLKPGYSPLEQFAAKGKIGPWTDIYAVGACMRLSRCPKFLASWSQRGWMRILFELWPFGLKIDGRQCPTFAQASRGERMLRFASKRKLSFPLLLSRRKRSSPTSIPKC